MHVAQWEVEAHVNGVDNEQPLRQARVDGREMRARSLEESTPRNSADSGGTSSWRGGMWKKAWAISAERAIKSHPERKGWRTVRP